MKLKTGQGFTLSIGTRKQYCLIVNINESNVEYVHVNAIVESGQPRVRMYDDSDAVYETDKDNVCLADCPPPFTDLSFLSKDGKLVNNAYAVADMHNVKSINKLLIEASVFRIKIYKQFVTILGRISCKKKRNLQIQKEKPRLRACVRG